VLASILVLSAVVRIILCLSGGQDYWPDEERDNPGRMLQGLLDRDYKEVFSAVDDPHRPVFTVLAMVPAAIGRVTGHVPMVEALFFSMASIARIWLLAPIARALGADDIEALLAAGLLAISTSFLYWSRHVQSYDLAMMFALLALLAGIRRGRTGSGLYLCGLIDGVAFLAYPGYWTGVAAVASLCVMRNSAHWRNGLVNTALVSAGVATLPVLAVTISSAAGGQMLTRFVTYSSIIAQGSLQEGWSLPFEYLWHAEHLLLVLWLASALWAVTQFNARSAVGTGALGAVLIYVMLVVFSVGLPKFVVYGRLVRQIVPFLCLVTAAAINSLWQSPTPIFRFAAVAIVGAALVQAAVNFRQPLLQSFPADFVARNRPTNDVATKYQQLMWVNIRHLYPRPEPVTLPPHHVTLAEARHPLEFLPYQYEGYTPEDRAALRAADIHMRLVGVLP